MTGSELVSALNRITGRGENVDTIRYINFALKRIARTGLFSQSQETSAPLFTGTVSAPFPADMLFPIDWRIIDGASSKVIEFMPKQEFDERFPYPQSTGTGKPEFYTRWGRSFLVNKGAPEFTDGTLEIATGDKDVLIGDSDCLWSTAETAGTIAAGDYFSADDGVTWIAITSIDSETSIDLADDWTAAVAAGSSYRIRNSYTTSLRYIENPATNSGEATEQPFTSYDDVVIAAAAAFAYIELEEPDKTAYWEVIYKDRLAEAAGVESKFTDSKQRPRYATRGKPTDWQLDPTYTGD